jgi:hypothetical protein
MVRFLIPEADRGSKSLTSGMANLHHPSSRHTPALITPPPITLLLTAAIAKPLIETSGYTSALHPVSHMKSRQRRWSGGGVGGAALEGRGVGGEPGSGVYGWSRSGGESKRGWKSGARRAASEGRKGWSRRWDWRGGVGRVEPAGVDGGSKGAAGKPENPPHRRSAWMGLI